VPKGGEADGVALTLAWKVPCSKLQRNAAMEGFSSGKSNTGRVHSWDRPSVCNIQQAKGWLLILAERQEIGQDHNDSSTLPLVYAILQVDSYPCSLYYSILLQSLLPHVLKS
jgi:hypothetical protein